MEPSLLMWRFFVFIVVPGCMTEVCHDDPPSLRNAMFKVLRYKVGTMINCDCKTGFRRVSVVMRCAGNSSHSAWENRCLCNSISPAKNPVKQVTPGPKEQNERKPTDVQSQTQPPEQADLPDFQKPTEEVATLDTFIFTTEYQIAVAGCILLLASVLLLSCLTWRRRWKKNRRTI
ncbi:interleukin-2 receptor subunit alpha isoform 3-T3 [Dama dama]